MLEVARKENARQPEEEDDQRRVAPAERRRDQEQNRNGEQCVQRRKRLAGHADAKEESRNGKGEELRHAYDFAAKASGARHVCVALSLAKGEEQRAGTIAA